MALRASLTCACLTLMTVLLAGRAGAGQVEGDGSPAGPAEQRPTLVASNTYPVTLPDRVAGRVERGLVPSERRSATAGDTGDPAAPLGASALVDLLGDPEERASIHKQEITQSLRRQLEEQISIRR